MINIFVFFTIAELLIDFFVFLRKGFNSVTHSTILFCWSPEMGGKMDGLGPFFI